MVRIHINRNKQFTIANLYIPPHYATLEADITYCIEHITNITVSILTGDVNAQSTLWHSYTGDHRGTLISNITFTLTT